MANLIPADWRQSFGRFRDDVANTVRRWLPRGKRKNDWESDEERRLPATFFSAGPFVEIKETDDEVMVRAELPGYDRDDFTLDLTGNRLVLRGEKKHSREERREGYYYSEQSYGSFARPVHLPCEVDIDKAEARFKNGLLRVTLSKAEQARARRVKVRVH
jgi:HSP20 family protein